MCVCACTHQLREYTKELRAVVSKDGDDSSVVSILTRQMKEIYRIVSICLGIPPETFTWEYYDKSKTYHKIGPITPIDFYNEYVKPVYNVEDKVWKFYILGYWNSSLGTHIHFCGPVYSKTPGNWHLQGFRGAG